jgi:hypothetical protein
VTVWYFAQGGNGAGEAEVGRRRLLMPARTKGRAKFDFRGRPFVWWVDGDYWLRIASLDKRFVVAYALGRAIDQPPILTVHGQEFAGLTSADRRPVYVIAPELSGGSGGSMGAWVDQLLTWAFDPLHELIKVEGPPRFS